VIFSEQYSGQPNGGEGGALDQADGQDGPRLPPSLLVSERPSHLAARTPARPHVTFVAPSVTAVRAARRLADRGDPRSILRHSSGHCFVGFDATNDTQFTPLGPRLGSLPILPIQPSTFPAGPRRPFPPLPISHLSYSVFTISSHGLCATGPWGAAGVV
jgi:hypothetical protein